MTITEDQNGREPVRAGSSWGFHLRWAVVAIVTALVVPAHAAPIIDLVVVGDPGNGADANGYGAVSASFSIMKFEFTNNQYVEFLNSVAASDTYSLYNSNMGNDARGGIKRSGTSGAFTYSAKTNMGQKPVNYVSWFDAARVANWLHNGATRSSSTETGAYTLNGLTSGDAVPANVGAKFRVPTENEWYKAAYYKGGSIDSGYWTYATKSDTPPVRIRRVPKGTGTSDGRRNSANWNRAADWNGQDGNVTTVGRNGRPGVYSAFDMSGNVSEWNDLDGTSGSLRGIRGGGWNGSAYALSSSSRGTSKTTDETFHSLGFRLVAPIAYQGATPEQYASGSTRAETVHGGYSAFVKSGAVTIDSVAVKIEMVRVGNPGNSNDVARVSGSDAVYGRVDYTYQIGKYPVTIGQYAKFLNAVDPGDTNPHDIYNSHIATNPNIAGISFDANGISGATYAVMAPAGFVPGRGVTGANRPVTYVSWFDAARFANWMTNGQGAGDTETGAYTLNGLTSGYAVAANFGAKFRLATENEWYKAAFYSPRYGGAGVPGYYKYATQSDADPGNMIGYDPNQADYYIAPPVGVGFSVTKVDTRDDTQNYLTDVGAFSRSGSFYGTFDQSGNLYQWNDLDGTAGSASSRGLRAGASGINLTASDLSYSNRLTYPPESEGKFGFRLSTSIP